MKLKFMVLALAAVWMAAAALGAEVKIENDVFLRGGDGEVVCRQGGGIFRFRDGRDGKMRYFRYGVRYKAALEYAADPSGVKASDYSGEVVLSCSDDFAVWRDCGVALSSGELPSGWVGRMGVAYVAALDEYALFIQSDARGVFVATSKTPYGPFRHSHDIDMTAITGYPTTGDQTVFTDEDTHKSYLVFSKPRGREKIFVGEIGVDATGKIGLVRCECVFKGFNREANCMFKRGGKYYLCASNIYGWDASLAYWLVGDTPFGPFEERAANGDMNVMAGSERDYAHVSQVGFFYTLRGADGRELVLYFGDRWSQWADNGRGFEVCEPIAFDEAGAPHFHSLSSWWLDPANATWRVAADNNWCLNGSFDADRRILPLTEKPRQEHITGWEVEVLEGSEISLANPASPHLIASNSVPDHAFVSGKFALSINDTVPFRRRVSQTLAGLSDGEYTLSYMIDEGSGWQRRTETLAATNSVCKIVFDRSSPCRIDDVTLVRKDACAVPMPDIQEAEVRLLGGAGFTAVPGTCERTL